MMAHLHVIAACLAFLLAGPTAVQGQAEATGGGAWDGWVLLDVVGRSFEPKRVLGAGGLQVLGAEFFLSREWYWVGLRGVAMFDDDWGSGSSVSEFAALAGLSHRRGRYEVGVGAGIGRVDPCEPRRVDLATIDYGECPESHTWGVPMTFRASVSLTGRLGIGAQALMNFNSASVVTGWAGFVQIGRRAR